MNFKVGVLHDCLAASIQYTVWARILHMSKREDAMSYDVVNHYPNRVKTPAA